MFNGEKFSQVITHQGNLVCITGRLDSVEQLPSTGSYNQMYLIGAEDATRFKKYLWNVSTQQWDYKGVSVVMDWDDKQDLLVLHSSGTAAAQEITEPRIPELYEGLQLVIIPSVNLSASPTLNINGLGAIPIKRRNNANGTLYAGAHTGWLAAEHAYTLVYSDGNFIVTEFDKVSFTDTVGYKHDSTSTTYGAGSKTNYGHVKLVDDLEHGTYADGEALAASEGFNLKNSVDNLSSGIKYYGAPDTIPSDSSYFVVTGKAITGLTDEGKGQTKLVIPYEIDGVEIERIGSNAFENCTTLTTIAVPSNISAISESAFLNCTSLTALNIPKGVVFINLNMCRGCTSLKEIIIPDGVRRIDYGAFYGCTSLEKIVISKSVQSIEVGSFEGCPNLTIYCEQGSYAETYAKSNNIPAVYTDIKADILATKEYVDGKVSSMYRYNGDPDIVPSDESYFTVNETGETITGLTDAGKTQTELIIPYKINGKLITGLCNDRENTSILDGNTIITKVIIPNSVTNIGGSAFRDCTSLTSINIPNNVTNIGISAFLNCTSLKSINIPNSVRYIDISAFNGCTSLTSINIPNSVTSIDTFTFNGCTSLKEINIPNSVTHIENDAFNGCTNLKIYCEQGSYAETYAQTNSIPIIYTDISSATINAKANAADVYTKSEVDSKVSSVYKYKGTVPSAMLLPDNKEVGDVYNTTFAGYVYSVSDKNFTLTGISSSDGESININSEITLTFDKNISEVGAAAFVGTGADIAFWFDSSKFFIGKVISFSGNSIVVKIADLDITNTGYYQNPVLDSVQYIFSQFLSGGTTSIPIESIRYFAAVDFDFRYEYIPKGGNVAYSGGGGGNNGWDSLGSTIDTSNFATKDEMNSAITTTLNTEV